MKSGLYQTYLEKINQYIQQHPYQGFPPGLYDPINYTMALGGKRIRPVLTLMACNLFGGDMEKALPVATALEVFHNFTLVHDDIMDNAPLRRGKPTVYTKWNPNIAILAGDLMLIKSIEMFEGLEGDTYKKCLTLFTRTGALVCDGQQLDMDFEQADEVHITAYLQMIELKTAVLLACSLKMGAYLANAPEADAEHLYQFGKHIGLAFQLQDDILDVFAPTPEFGKKAGGDIIANKKTFLLIRALELAKGKTADELNHWLNRREVDEAEKVAAVKEIYAQLGVKALAEEEMNSHLLQAFNHLKQVAVDEEKKQPLIELAAMLQQRNT